MKYQHMKWQYMKYQHMKWQYIIIINKIDFSPLYISKSINI